MKKDKPPKAPAHPSPEPSAFEKMERMKDFTRRLLAVPKSEISKPKPHNRKST